MLDDGLDVFEEARYRNLIRFPEHRADCWNALPQITRPAECLDNRFESGSFEVYKRAGALAIEPASEEPRFIEKGAAMLAPNRKFTRTCEARAVDLPNSNSLITITCAVRYQIFGRERAVYGSSVLSSFIF